MMQVETTIYRNFFGEKVELTVEPNAMGGVNVVLVTTKDSTGMALLDGVRGDLNYLGLYSETTDDK